MNSLAAVVIMKHRHINARTPTHTHTYTNETHIHGASHSEVERKIPNKLWGGKKKFALEVCIVCDALLLHAFSSVFSKSRKYRSEIQLYIASLGQTIEHFAAHWKT